jgi:hypothetical protein
MGAHSKVLIRTWRIAYVFQVHKSLCLTPVLRMRNISLHYPSSFNDFEGHEAHSHQNAEDCLEASHTSKHINGRLHAPRCSSALRCMDCSLVKVMGINVFIVSVASITFRSTRRSVALQVNA